MTLEAFRISRRNRDTVDALFAVEQEMWDTGWDAIHTHTCNTNMLAKSFSQDQRVGLAAMARLRESSPYTTVEITRVDSAVRDTTAVLHYIVVLKIPGYRTPKIGSCMSTYCSDAAKPSGWALLSHHFKTIPPKRFRAIMNQLALG